MLNLRNARLSPRQLAFSTQTIVVPAWLAEAERQAALATAISNAALFVQRQPSTDLCVVTAGHGGDITHSAVQSFNELTVWRVGRHGHSDVTLRSSHESLRQALLVHRAGQGGVYVNDLRGAGLVGVDGTPLLVGHYRLPLIIQTAHGWVFVAQGGAAVNAWDSVSPPASESVGVAMFAVRATIEFHLISPGPTTQVPMSSEVMEFEAMQLARGVLVGRDIRCDTPRHWKLVPSDLSRVHAAMIAMDEAVYFVDTASSAGSEHRDHGVVRFKRLQEGDVFWLGKQTRLSIERIRRDASRI